MVMPMNVTLVLKKVYRTGRESGERRHSARRVRFVRAHWFLLLAGLIQKMMDYPRYIEVTRYDISIVHRIAKMTQKRL